MTKQLHCPCANNPLCKLCGGRGLYDYEPGPRGWMPFVCPTCEGRGHLELPGEPERDCPTCHGAKNIDPADTPVGIMGKIRKMFFGG